MIIQGEKRGMLGGIAICVPNPIEDWTKMQDLEKTRPTGGTVGLGVERDRGATLSRLEQVSLYSKSA